MYTELANSIGELTWYKLLEDLCTEYQAAFGAEPFDLSHWDPASELMEPLTLFSPTPDSLINYIYTDAVESFIDDTAQKLGYGDGEYDATFTNNGTIAMLGVLNFLRLSGSRHVHTVCPYYYPFEYQSQLMGLRLCKHYLERENGTFRLPPHIPEHINISEPLWLTSPIFCTSVYYGDDDICRLQTFLSRGGTLVLDESLALWGNELVRKLGTFPGLIGIHTPHKGISVNGFKFSVIIANKRVSHAIQEWTDVVLGGLNIASAMAIRHFLSGEFDGYAAVFSRRTGVALMQLRSLLAEYEGVETDQRQIGHFAMCYFPLLRADLANSREFLRMLIRKSGAVFYPGIRNHFDPSFGFCFRVNLARKTIQFDASLRRLLSALCPRTLRSAPVVS